MRSLFFLLPLLLLPPTLAAAESVSKLTAQLVADSPLARYEAARDLGAMGAKARGALPELIDLLGDEEAWVRMEAGRALVTIGITEHEIRALISRLEVAPAEVAHLIAEALADHPKSVPPLIQALADDGEPRLVREAIYALRLAGRKAAPAIPRILQLTASKDPAVQKAASEALRRLAPWAGDAVDELQLLTASNEGDVAWVAIRLLAGAGPAAKSAIPALRELAASKDTRIASAADQALKQIDVVVSVEEALFQPQAATARAPDKYSVLFTTTQGEFTIEVERELAPKGADRFYNLVKLGYFDGAHFFRVIPNFVAQFGLHANPRISAAWKSAKIDDDPVRAPNLRGTICFATAGAGTRTTQLFINLGDNQRLDASGFAPFGKVTSGWKVVEKLHTGYGDQPDQMMINLEGAVYLEREYPKLDKIRKAELKGAK